MAIRTLETERLEEPVVTAARVAQAAVARAVRPLVYSFIKPRILAETVNISSPMRASAEALEAVEMTARTARRKRLLASPHP